MTKLQFLMALHQKLAGLPQDEVEERLRFYSEMIEDRMEDGLSEEEAVAAVGSVDEIAAQIAAEIPHPVIAKTKGPRNPLSRGVLLLLILGSPVWFSLLIAAFAIGCSLYASLWAVVISLWAVFASLIGCAVGISLAGVGLMLFGQRLPGIAMVGAGLVCAGLAVLMFFGCKAATLGTVLLTRKLFKCITSRIHRKEVR